MKPGKPGLSKGYLVGIIALTIVLPAVSVFIEMVVHNNAPVSVVLVGKWFIFWASGMRLFVAGLKQVLQPGFTAKNIFHLQGTEAHVIITELGFANICTGLVGLLSLFFPGWRIVSAFGSGLYYGLAGIYHIIKKPVGPNEQVALASDIVIFIALAAYTMLMFGVNL